MLEPTRKILIIDDDEAVFLYFKKKLGRFYHIIVTTDPSEAIHLAINQRPNLVLCDIAMPGLNGGDLSGMFYENEQTRAIPFVFLTSLLSPAEISSRQGHIGARHAIAKSSSVDELVHRIEREISAGADCCNAGG